MKISPSILLPTTLSSLFLFTSLLVQIAEGTVKCFCDRSSCHESLICTGDYCVIGLRKDGDASKLHQLCADGNVGEGQCQRHTDNWQEMCHCTDDFCNTFAYLRMSLDQAPNEKDDAVFSYSDPVHPVHSGDDGARTQRSSLIVLLVIIPLSVGGMAVCLIFLNYHCKMC